MSVFLYKARDQAGSLVTDMIEAGDRVQAIRKLESMKLLPIKLTESQPQRARRMPVRGIAIASISVIVLVAAVFGTWYFVPWGTLLPQRVWVEAKDQAIWIGNGELSAKYKWDGDQGLCGPAGTGMQYLANKKVLITGNPWFGYGNLKIEGSAVASEEGITLQPGSKLMPQQRTRQEKPAPRKKEKRKT